MNNCYRWLTIAGSKQNLTGLFAYRIIGHRVLELSNKLWECTDYTCQVSGWNDNTKK